MLQHTSSRCNTLGILQHTTTHYKTLPNTATHCNIPGDEAGQLQHAPPADAKHCNMLQHITTHYNTLQHTATHYIKLQHTATHCNTLQHTATHCNTLQHTCRRSRAITARVTSRGQTLPSPSYSASWKYINWVRFIKRGGMEGGREDTACV